MKKYYFPDDTHLNSWFWDQDPICLTWDEAERLARAWETEDKSADDILSQLHEATDEEIAKYGV